MTNLALAARTEHPPTMAEPAPARRITPNLFAISFGLAGLAETWTTAARLTAAPAAVADSLWIVAAGVWLLTLALYGRSVVTGHRWRTELADHTFGPFVAVPAIVGLLLAGALAPHARIPALALFSASLVASIVLAGRLLALWALDDAPETHWHPGYYLPSVGAHSSPPQRRSPSATSASPGCYSASA